jgi:hypothetical protein
MAQVQTPIPGGWNQFYAWLKRNDCFVKNNKGIPKAEVFSHLLLSGGRLNVPDALHEQFYMEILQAAQVRMEPIYLVEMPTLEGFKLFCELDLVLDSKVLSTEDIRDHILPPIQTAMRTAFPDKDTRVIVCTAESKVVTSKETNNPAVKNGIHLIWPSIIVNRDIAMMVRSVMLFYLFKHTLPVEWAANGLPHEGWDASLDKAVFDKNGLRPIWSRKASICPSCHNQRGTEKTRVGFTGSEVLVCSVCLNVGRVDDGRPYDIVDVVSDRGLDIDKSELSDLRKDWMLQLKTSSIRIVPRATPDMLCVPKLAEMPQDLRKFCETMISKGNKGMGKKRKLIDDASLDGPGTRARALASGSSLSGPPSPNPHAQAGKASDDYLYSVDYSDPECTAIFGYAKEVLNVVPATLKRNKHKSIYIMTTWTNTCLNKGGDHKHATVYFIFNIEGIYQLCWSRTPTVYQPSGKSCKDYRSPPIPYDPDRKKALLEIIFSENIRRIHPEDAGIEKRQKKIDRVEFKPYDPDVTSALVKINPDAQPQVDEHGLLPLALAFELIDRRTQMNVQKHRDAIAKKKAKLDGAEAARALKVLTSPKLAPQATGNMTDDE